MSNLISPDQRRQLIISYAVLEAGEEDWCRKFYENLFTDYPEARHLFTGSIQLQSDKLSSILWMVLGMIEDEKQLLPTIQALGRRHLEYGVKEEHYGFVKDALMKTIKEQLGSAYRPEIGAAWNDVFDVLAGIMIAAGKE